MSERWYAACMRVAPARRTCASLQWSLVWRVNVTAHHRTGRARWFRLSMARRQIGTVTPRMLTRDHRRMRHCMHRALRAATTPFLRFLRRLQGQRVEHAVIASHATGHCAQWPIRLLEALRNRPRGEHALKSKQRLESGSFRFVRTRCRARNPRQTLSFFNVRFPHTGQDRPHLTEHLSAGILVQLRSECNCARFHPDNRVAAIGTRSLAGSLLVEDEIVAILGPISRSGSIRQGGQWSDCA